MKAAYLSMRQRFLRWNVILMFVIASSALMAQPAQASNSAENHCITPLGDLNQIYGIYEQIVTVFCPRVNSGAYWVAAGGPPWFMNTSFELVPEGFVPAGETPLEDFRAKFVAVKYVIDPGTLQERIHIFPTSDKLWTGPHPIVGLPAVHPITLGALRPSMLKISPSARLRVATSSISVNLSATTFSRTTNSTGAPVSSTTT